MPETDLLSFDRWLRRRRKSFDLTQDQIARQVGCSVETIRKIEAGERRPSRQIAELLGKALQLSDDEQELFVRIARMEPGPRQDELVQSLPAFPLPPAAQPQPLTAMTSSRHRLPNPPWLIGRERELAGIHAYLEQPNIRLLNLTGPGGIGKTSLALRIAANLATSFPDGVFFVPLVTLTDATLVGETIVHALGLQHTDSQSVAEVISAALHDRQVLLVLDNFEHLLEAAAVIDALLAGTSRLKILVTSRTRLRLYHEHIVPIQPLSLAVRAAAPAGITAEQALHSDAVKLFMRRAQMIQPGWTLDQSNAAIVAEICERLDGMPLAIELAAARTPLLPPAALLRRLKDRFALLSTGIANVPERHQTLRATLDWSYQLLTAEEQQLFMRLAIFPGGCTIDAIEHVIAELPASTSLAMVESLLHKSLLNQSSVSDEPWFSMLETVAAYAGERLAESGTLKALRHRSARYYVALVEALEDELSGPQQEHYLALVAREHDNLRALLVWLLDVAAEDKDSQEQALRLCGVLWRFWWVRGYLHEGRRYLDRALDHGETAPAHLRAKVLHGAGILARAQGDLQRAETFLTNGLALWRELNYKPGIALALNSLGVLLFNQRAYDRATPFFEESKLLHQSLGDQRRVAVALNNLGNIAYKQGDLQQATERYQASLQLLGGDHSHRQTIALIQTNLADIARLRQDYAGATRMLYESAGIYRELNEVEGILFCLNNLTEIAIDRRQPEQAARILGVEDALYAQIGAVRSPDQAADYERQVVAIRSQTEPEVFESARLQGRAIPVDHILEEVLTTLGSA
ncbi:MAG TPA: tetratricopeptide repeat protein [Herpetosiphonaceae bacterium]